MSSIIDEKNVGLVMSESADGSASSSSSPSSDDSPSLDNNAAHSGKVKGNDSESNTPVKRNILIRAARWIIPFMPIDPPPVPTEPKMTPEATSSMYGKLMFNWMDEIMKVRVFL